MKAAKPLFFILLLLFLVINGYFILTIQGLTVDFADLKIIKTGGVYVSAVPTDADVFLNNKYYRPSFFSSHKRIYSPFFNEGRLIKNLKPGDYRLRLTKTGFQGWEKDFTVAAGVITELKKIALVPTVVKLEPLKNESAENFWLTDKNLIRQDGKKRLLTDKNQLIKGVTIEAVSEKSSLVVTKDNAGNFFLTDLNDSAGVINLNYLFDSLRERQLKITAKTTIKKIWFHPFSSTKVIIQTTGAVYVLDWQKLEVETLIKDSGIKTIAVGRNEIFLTTVRRELITVNLLFKNKIVKDFDVDLNQITLNDLNTKIGLLTKNQFFLISRFPEELKTTSTIGSVKEFLFSPDNQYLAFLLDDGQVKIWDLKEDRISAVTWPGVNQIKSFVWPTHLPNYLLIVSADDKLMLADIFKNPPFNVYSLTADVKKYALRNKELYVLKKSGELLKTDLNF